MNAEDTKYLHIILDTYGHLLDAGQLDQFYERVKPLCRRDLSELLYELDPEVFSSLSAVPSWFMFNCMSVRHFDVPLTCTRIKRNAFDGCTNLKSITIPEGVTRIDSAAFRHSSLHKLSLPDSLESIDVSAFVATPLSAVELGPGLRWIGRDAFGFTSKLQSINYRGTVEQWNMIKKHSHWCYLSSINKVICSDGEVAIQQDS